MPRAAMVTARGIHKKEDGQLRRPTLSENQNYPTLTDCRAMSGWIIVRNRAPRPALLIPLPPRLTGRRVHMATMKAAVVRQFGAPLDVTDVEKPEVTDDGIVVNIAATGVCHTD